MGLKESNYETLHGELSTRHLKIVKDNVNLLQKNTALRFKLKAKTTEIYDLKRQIRDLKLR